MCGLSDWKRAVVFAIVMLATSMNTHAQEKKNDPPMKEWEQDVRKKMAKDDDLKKLAMKYPLVLLHSRGIYARDGTYKQSAFSFLYETCDAKKHGNNVQMIFDNGARDGTFQTSGSLCLFVDLGRVDFEKTPIPKRSALPTLGSRLVNSWRTTGMFTWSDVATTSAMTSTSFFGSLRSIPDRVTWRSCGGS